MKVLQVALVLALAVFASGCATLDNEHVMLVSVPEQKMTVLKKGVVTAEYPISTSKFGLGDRGGSCATPLGKMEVAKKIGGGAKPGTVFKSRRPTGEVVAPNSPGRDPIVSRILWLKGTESRNRNAFARFIYIHGTTEESKLGTPVSYGCIRMRSRDVIELYSMVGIGARVEVFNASTEAMMRGAPVQPSPKAFAAAGVHNRREL